MNLPGAWPATPNPFTPSASDADATAHAAGENDSFFPPAGDIVAASAIGLLAGPIGIVSAVSLTLAGEMEAKALAERTATRPEISSSTPKSVNHVVVLREEQAPISLKGQSLISSASRGSEAPIEIGAMTTIPNRSPASAFAQQERVHDQNAAASGATGAFGASAAEFGIGPAADLNEPIPITARSTKAPILEPHPVEPNSLQIDQAEQTPIAAIAPVQIISPPIPSNGSLSDEKNLHRHAVAIEPAIQDATHLSDERKENEPSRMVQGITNTPPSTRDLSQLDTLNEARSEQQPHRIAEAVGATALTGGAVYEGNKLYEQQKSKNLADADGDALRSTQIASAAADTDQRPTSRFSEGLGDRSAPAQDDSHLVAASRTSGLGNPASGSEQHHSVLPIPAHDTFEEQRAEIPDHPKLLVSGAVADQAGPSLAAAPVPVHEQPPGLHPATFEQDIAHLSNTPSSSQLALSAHPQNRDHSFEKETQNLAGGDNWEQETLAALGGGAAVIGATAYASEQSSRNRNEGALRDIDQAQPSRTYALPTSSTDTQDQMANATPHHHGPNKLHKSPRSSSAATEARDEPLRQSIEHGHAASTIPRATENLERSGVASALDDSQINSGVPETEFSPHMHIAHRKDSVGHHRLHKASHDPPSPPNEPTPASQDRYIEADAPSPRHASATSSLGVAGTAATSSLDSRDQKGQRPTLPTLMSEDRRGETMQLGDRSNGGAPTGSNIRRGRASSISSPASTSGAFPPASPSTGTGSGKLVLPEKMTDKERRRASHGSESSSGTGTSGTPTKRRSGFFSRFRKDKHEPSPTS